MSSSETSPCELHVMVRSLVTGMVVQMRLDSGGTVELRKLDLSSTSTMRFTQVLGLA